MKPFYWFKWYKWLKMAFKMSQEFPTASLDITKITFETVQEFPPVSLNFTQRCMYPSNSAWPAFLVPFLLLLPACGHLSRGFTVPPTKRAYSVLHPQALAECSLLDFRRLSIDSSRFCRHDAINFKFILLALLTRCVNNGEKQMKFDLGTKNNNNSITCREQKIKIYFF